MVNIKFGTFSKKRNSTKQASDDVFTASFDVVLKEGCSDRNPSFLLQYNPGSFNFNYCKWGSWYYFVDDIIYEKNNLVRVNCSVDVLATWKSQILNTHAFIAYSSISGGQWLPDRRVPVKSDCTVSKSAVGAPFMYPSGGRYILSVIGDNGAVSYFLTLGGLRNLIRAVNNANTTFQQAFEALDFSTVENALKSVGSGLVQTGLMGNGYENAPSCIRSCHWMPFRVTDTEGVQEIYLGSYATGVSAGVIDAAPLTGSVSVSIPWQYSDWRRAYCEDVYIYLPLVGMVSLASENLTHASSVTVYYSYTLTDGQICYQVVAGNEIIGSYGGTCIASYPIGINQHASPGAIANSLMGGLGKAVTGALTSPIPALSAVTGVVSAGLDAANTALSTNPSCIGGIGGGAGSGLDHNITCYTVAHSTSCEPSEMRSVLGVPTMRPAYLSSCTGYCQCTDAHCAIPASGDIINAVDVFLNSGFFIE